MVREGNTHKPVIFTKESEEWPFLRAFPWVQSVSITQEWRWVKMLRSGGRQHQEPQEKLLTIKFLPFPITYLTLFPLITFYLISELPFHQLLCFSICESYPSMTLGLNMWSSFRFFESYTQVLRRYLMSLGWKWPHGDVTGVYCLEASNVLKAVAKRMVFRALLRVFTIVHKGRDVWVIRNWLAVLRTSYNCINGWEVLSIVSRLVHCLR